jgi:hypothetical protein
MHAINRAVKLLFAVFLLTFALSITQSMAEKNSGSDEGLIHSGKEKQREEDKSLRTKIEFAGVIINFSEIAKYMTRESCFQIVKIPENQNFEGQVDAQGRYKLNSTLPKLKISKNGSFAGNLLPRSCIK